jgi:tetrahydromethanopterin S-methyltransferase subunit G
MPEMREEIQAQLDMFRRQETRAGALVGLVVGLLLGWFLLGWWLFPVRWVNVPPSDLHPEWQRHYIAMVVDSYIVTEDFEAVEKRLESFDRKRLAELFAAVEAEFQERGGERQLRAARELAERLGLGTPVPEAAVEAVTPTAPEAAQVTEEPVGRGSLLGRAVQALFIVLAVLAVVVLGLVAFLYTRTRIAAYVAKPGEEEQVSRIIGTVDVGEVVTPRYEGQGPKYEQSYQIYEGERIVGECGLRALPLLAKGDAVAAYAVWLYETAFPERSPDTCVLVSEAVYEDEGLLRAVQQDHTGDRVLLAEPGVRIRLHHTNLTLEVEIVDAEYTGPDRFYFSELAVALRPVLRVTEDEAAAG